MVAALSLKEKNQNTINQAIRELQNGRNNSTGTVTLAVSPATTTTVQAPTCSPTSVVVLLAQTAHAAAVTGLFYTAQKGQFVLTYTATANSDCTFGWAVLGGN